MMPSLYSGVSGLKNHGVRMNVIGNNISNVNTYGYKYSRVTFHDMLSQTLAGAAAPEDSKGGVNPKQMGLGMSIASIDKIMTQGTMQNTGKDTDLAIYGDGFFVMREGEELFYTRAGNFDFDEEGIFVNPANGLKVQGWMAQEAADGSMRIDASSTSGDIIIPKNQKLAASETGNMFLKCNLNSELPPTVRENLTLDNSYATSVAVYDSEGGKHTARLQFFRTAENAWSVIATVSEAEGPITLDVTGGDVVPAGATDQLNLTFDPLGTLATVTDAAGSPAINQGNAIVNLRFAVPGRNQQNVSIHLGDIGRTDNTITQFSQDNTTKIFKQDGYAMGYLKGVVFDDSGIVTGTFDNGQKKMLAQVAMSSFANPEGLEKAGQNLYTATNNSGLADIGRPGKEGRGKINAGSLEMSNVDLAEQFTDMIVTQRGFQANSRTITTSDQMIQELLGLKR